MTNPIHDGNPSDGRKRRYRPRHQMVVLIWDPGWTPSPPCMLSRSRRPGRPRRRAPRRATRTLTLKTSKVLLQRTKTSFHCRKDPILEAVDLPQEVLVLLMQRLVSL